MFRAVAVAMGAESDVRVGNQGAAGAGNKETPALKNRGRTVITLKNVWK